MKGRLFQIIDKVEPDIYELANEICDYAELPYEEYQSAKALEDWLKKEGFNVERGLCNLPTAFRATYRRGEGGRRLGMLCEYDALPNGHTCGHYMQGPSILAAAKALKDVVDDNPYELIIYGTPAEEVNSGKPAMGAGGCFQDIDCVLMCHARSCTTLMNASLSGIDLVAEFTGVHAHDTVEPWNNRSGFDAMLLAVQGIEYLRGHIYDGTRIFYLLKDGIGIEGNTDPSHALIQFSVRNLDNNIVQDLARRVSDIIRGAALMSGVNVDIKRTLEFKGILKNDTIGNALIEEVEDVGGRKIVHPPSFTGGSNDFGYVSWMVPSAELGICMSEHDYAQHTLEILQQFRSEYGRPGITQAAKAIAAVGYRLISDESFFKTALNEFEERKAGKYNYGSIR